MKGITLVQAFQYWAKMFAISAPIFVLMAIYGGYHAQLAANRTHHESLVQSRQAIAVTPPQAPKDESWISPFGSLTTKAAAKAGLKPQEQRPYSLLYTYSLIIALVCGTAGLPPILVCFYT